ncbi:MAG: peptidoglycan editing factor PgeF [Campylobacterota bacterium]|nr:peptidoglycan editing factor PgeF [Campylobacterota bacterium]
MINSDNISIVFTTKDDKNIAYHVTKDKKSVDISREILAHKYNFDPANLKYMDQIHSNIVKKVDKRSLYEKCDALVTNMKHTPLMVMVADCIPMVFYDSKKGVVAVAHAGRVGTLNNISANVVDMMCTEFYSKVQDIQVILGPSIQKCCYEVSTEMAHDTGYIYGKEFVKRRYIDLQGINKSQLLKKGILSENINISDICTKCSNENYFSYRVDKRCGRFAAIVILK